MSKNNKLNVKQYFSLFFLKIIVDNQKVMYGLGGQLTGTDSVLFLNELKISAPRIIPYYSLTGTG